MSKLLVPPASHPFQKKEDDLARAKKDLRLIKATAQVGQSLISSNPEKALHQAIVAGIKMADEGVFKNPLASPLHIVDALKKIGIQTLTWSPEILMSEIDKQTNGWGPEKVAEALQSFHDTGIITTDVPKLVREKIYAIRVIATSNSAQCEWHTFEKVGGAFNDRVAKFGVLEPLSPAECAKTVAIIEEIRPDTYDNEIKIYIAACCHQDGFYTVTPSKWLSMAEPFLQQMNFEGTGEHVDAAVKNRISSTYHLIKQRENLLQEVPEDLVSVQAFKLLAVDTYAESAE